jgi:hypothetical protein
MKYKIQLFWQILFLVSIFTATGALDLIAQELNCTVSVNSRQISGSSYNYISELEDDVENYMNQNRWTNDRFEERERIICSIQIVITSVDDQFNYTSEAFFTAQRPIYNTNRQTNTIVVGDTNWRFSYPRNKNLIFDDLQFDDLTTFLDFYAYIILGYDYDSFSELGGSSHFTQAQTFLELGQSSSSPGWGRSIGAQRNRYGLINDLTNPAYSDFRRAFYIYHRLGLDQFTINPQEARSQVIEALELIQENKRTTGNNYLFDLFFGTKSSEITAIFSDAERQVRLQAYNILRDVDPANTSTYESLQN